MIRRSAAIAAAAILLSLFVHFFGLTFTAQLRSDQPAEASATDTVALGSAFEDVAEAVAEPASPEPAPIPEPPVETPPEPEEAVTPEEPRTSEALVASDNPQRVFAPDTGAVKVVRPDTTGPASPDEIEEPAPEIVEPSGGDENAVADVTTTPPVEPDTVAKAPEGDPDASGAPEEQPPATAPVQEVQETEQVAALPAPSVPVLPVTPSPDPATVPAVPEESEALDPEAITPAPPSPNETEVVNETGASDLAVASSPRPRLPDRRPTAEPATDPATEPTTDPLGRRDGESEFSNLQFPPLMESPLTAYQQGRANLVIRPNSGTSSGGLGAVDARNTGNSDVTNYAGRVLVHLNRAPQVRVSGRGAARVFFEIKPDGTLGQVDIIDSTGSREIETAAKKQIRAAAPFPRPPQGVSRRLTFVYQTY